MGAEVRFCTHVQCKCVRILHAGNAWVGVHFVWFRFERILAESCVGRVRVDTVCGLWGIADDRAADGRVGLSFDRPWRNSKGNLTLKRSKKTSCSSTL